MATLFLFILGIVLITLLARYNESNKLFWTLLTCYTLGFVGAKIVYDTISEKKSNSTVVTVQPTQELTVTPASLLYLLADDSLSTPVKVTSNPVSQANVQDNSVVTSSGVSGETQKLMIQTLPNPPNMVEIVDDS